MSTNTYTGMPPPPRRHPLATNHGVHNVNLPRQQIPGSPPKQEDVQKQPSSPPLPRQNAKVTPPSPPKIITDKDGRFELTRVGMLGELWAEIKIHKSLEHPNIVKFQDCFEDDDNVYMTLELCHNGSLMDLLRRRRRFSEPEARFFMVQLIGACHYMHNHQVIHRDLKLGNIFLDANMNVKVGDFGLAALIESPGERKKTICGTPNYIAPEVLFDTANGHSFEVDTWSIGVILYTLVIGKPPFQTKDVKTIYNRIRNNEYDFPTDRIVSLEVQELVTRILTTDPSSRPTLHEILDNRWFTRGTVPSNIPVTAHDHRPDFSYITRVVSQSNLARLRYYALLDEESTPIAVPSAPSATESRMRSASSSLAQQEKEFHKAVQPGSPISALLSSARQPLLVAPPRGEQPLLRKLQAAKEARSPGRSLREARQGGLRNIDEEHDDAGTRAEEQRRKELESQKARIVAQMVPNSGTTSPVESDDQENMPPRTLDHKAYRYHEAAIERPPAEVPTSRQREVTQQKEKMRAQAPVASAGLPSSGSGSGVRINSFEAVSQTLTSALDARAAGRLFRDPRDDADLPEPSVFIVSWVDYCNKYGMGYALTDGSLGVHFNDTTTIVLSPDKMHFDYISSRRNGTVYVRKSYTISEYPEDLKTKVYLLKHFERYIMDRLYGDYAYTFQDTQRAKGMDFVQKYLRMKRVIVFKMSHDVLQFNFYEHSKLILSSHGLVVTHIDKNYKMSRFSLSEIMAMSLRPSADPEQAKYTQRLVEMLEYCNEVLITIRQVSAQVQDPASSPNTGPMPTSLPPPAQAGDVQTLTSRASKMALR
ncbi:hypothetical protein EW026_g6329 [Hermanssonia centrifuga]|uniref:Polo kinase n=1 Tax=Hermanssonia centrifuga TaxID=98765 RepID=A0A4S4KBC8_9APHY|nr:hypothetical protein EW026_g6329 [Hermanssonia centrifuga]